MALTTDVVWCMRGEQQPSSCGSAALSYDGEQLRFSLLECGVKVPAADLVSPAPAVCAGKTGAEIAAAFVPEAAANLQSGGSTVVASYGPDPAGAIDRLIGGRSAAAAIAAQLFATQRQVEMRAFSYQPGGGQLHDLVGGGAVRLDEAGLEGMRSAALRSEADALQQLERVSLRARLVLGVGDAAAADSPADAAAPAQMDLARVKAEPLRRGVYGDRATVVELKLPDASAAVSFVCLPDSERPAMPGVPHAAGAERYERVQAFNGDVLSLFRSARQRYARLAFGQDPVVASFRSWYSQSQAAAEQPSTPTHTVLLVDVAEHGSPYERFHEFTAGRRVLTHAGWDGPITRHRGCECVQLAAEVASMSVQLSVAAAVHKYRPRFKDLRNKALKDREAAAMEEEEAARWDRDQERHAALRERAERELQVLLEQELSGLRTANAGKERQLEAARGRSADAAREAAAARIRAATAWKEFDALSASTARLEADMKREGPRAKQARWAAAQCASLQEASVRDLRTAVTRSGEELRRAAEGQRCAALMSSAAGLEQLLPALMPAAPPAPLQAERIERARRRAADVVAQETAALQRTSAAACVGGGQVRKVWLRAESVVGLAATGGPYGVSAARGGCVQRAAVGGADELAFLTRLRPAGAQTDVVACAVTEAGTEGAVLAFDADLTALAALPAGPAVLTLPAAGERGPVRIHVHVRSVAMRPKQQAAPATPSPRRAASSPRRATPSPRRAATEPDSRCETTPSLGGQSSGDESGSRDAAIRSFG